MKNTGIAYSSADRTPVVLPEMAGLLPPLTVEQLAALEDMVIIDGHTRRELVNAVDLGERTMGKVMQIDEHAPVAVREALDSGDLSINQGYNITRQVQELPEVFSTIAGILETLLPGGDGDAG